MDTKFDIGDRIVVLSSDDPDFVGKHGFIEFIEGEAYYQVFLDFGYTTICHDDDLDIEDKILT